MDVWHKWTVQDHKFKVCNIFKGFETTVSGNNDMPPFMHELLQEHLITNYTSSKHALLIYNNAQ